MAQKEREEEGRLDENGRRMSMRGIENEQDNAIVRIEKCSRCSRKGGRGAQKERCYEGKTRWVLRKKVECIW